MSSGYSTPAGKVPLDYVLWLREIKTVEFAEQTGIDRRLIADYRQGKKPPPDRRRKIAKALKLSEEDLGWVVEGAAA